MSASTAPILVTGVTGRHGSTGAHLVRALLEQGRSVRVLVRKHTERAEEMRALGAEVMIGNLLDRRSLLPALDGIEEAYFTYPVGAGIVEAAASFASAGKAAKTLRRVVVMSMAPSDLRSPSHLGRAQALAEELLGWSGLELMILKVQALFFENLATLHSASVRDEGVIRNNFGQVALPWIAGADAAAIALAALLHPERFSEAAVQYPTGSEFLSHQDVAELMTQVFNRPIRYEEVDRAAWVQELDELAQHRPDYVNRDMARHISAVGDLLRLPGGPPVRRPDPDALQQLTGRALLGMREWLKQSREIFSADEQALA